MSRNYDDDDEQDSCVLVGTSLADLMPGMFPIWTEIILIMTQFYVYFKKQTL